MSSPYESYRGVIPSQNPNGDPATVIVTRQGLGQEARVWLTFSAAIKTTAAMTDREAAQLVDLINEARRTRVPNPH